MSRSRRRGFSLVEIALVILLLGVLAGVTVIQVGDSENAERSEQTRAKMEATFGARRLSTSLFSANFGLKAPPASVGLTEFSTVVLPPDMQRFDQYGDGATAMADAPRANEIVVAVVVTDSGRPHPRIGGLQIHEIVGQDGLR